MISTVTGYFRKFEGNAESTSDDFSGATVAFSLAVDSIDTNQSDRDQHLKSADFFDTANFPTISFAGKLVNQGGDYQLVGDLTLKGITKEVALEVTYGGTVGDPYGQTKAGFEIEGKINRKDFGMTFNKALDKGGLAVGEEVEIAFDFEAVPTNK